MECFEFSSPNGRVRIDWSFDGDYLVTVLANIHGFRGHAEGHVIKGEFEFFAKQLIALAKSRQGQASFEATDREDFRFAVKSIDRSGHVGVFGSLRFRPSGGTVEQQSLEFSLQFEPGQIESATAALRAVAA